MVILTTDGSGGGGGGPAAAGAAAVVVVAAVDDVLVVKVAGNESVDGRMMACDDTSGWPTTTQHPTNEWTSKSGRWWRRQ